MKKVTIIGIAVAIVGLLIACVKNLEDEGIYTKTEIVGSVVEKSTNAPVTNVKVLVTDGDHIHTSTITNQQGAFSLKVNFDEVDKSYFLLLDGSPNLPQKQEKLRGMGNKKYDYKALVLYDKTNTSLLPQVNTGNVSNLGVSTATVAGTVVSTGGHNLTERGVCYATHQTPTVSDMHKQAGAETGSFSCTLTGLQRNTTYYVRAYATNSIGTSYGVQKSFTTLSGTPSLSSVQSSEVKGNSAKVQCTISSDGGLTVSARGFCWGTTSNPTVQGQHSTDGTGTGSFTHTITSLQSSTTYYVRAYATNTQGTYYSTEATVTTTDGRPSVITSSPSAVTATSATIGGSVSSDGGFTITEKGVCYGTSQQPTISGQHVGLGTGTAAFSTTISQLVPGTVYYVRAYAVNEKGTSYGEQKSFTTGSGLPTVTTTAITLNGDNVVTGGNVTSDGGFPVTARGICYGIYPNPDLSSAYTHTTNGTGMGYYTSTFVLPAGTTYYVRAYATNANGTSYGSQVVAAHPYDTLPTFQFNGHTYKVAPCPNASEDEYMSWSAANNYCENLTAYGYSDWRMPTLPELQTMYQYRASIGGWFSSYTSTSNTPCYPVYWSSNYSGGYYYFVKWTDGSSDYGYYGLQSDGYYQSGSGSSSYFYIAHVRPIRIDE